MKFIPRAEAPKWKNVFSNFNDFRRRMNNKMFFFVEKKPGTFVKDDSFRIKSNWVAPMEFNDVNTFCWNVREHLRILFESRISFGKSPNLSNKEMSTLRKLRREKNKKLVINDTDKNVGPACADKDDVIKECKRQLDDIEVYLKLSNDQVQELIRQIQNQLVNIIDFHKQRGNCSKREEEFLISKLHIFIIPHFYILWKILKDPIVGRPIVSGCNWILTPVSIFVGHHLKKFCEKFDTILPDTLNLVKMLETKRFEQDCFLFTIDFKSLYTNIPVDHAIEMMKEIIFEHKDIISNGDFILDLLNLVLKNSLMQFREEFFQQIFEVIMGTNVAPILVNLYMAKLEKILKEKCFANPKLIWPVFYVRFIDDGFGITKGSRQDVEYWIAEFNKLVQSIIIDKYTYGTQVAFMDLFIYKSDRFRKYGKYDINIFQKAQNKYVYIPQKSYHRKHTIKNYVLNELRRYVKYNTEKCNYLKLRNKFFDRLRNRGFRKHLLKKLFQHISYAKRNIYLNLLDTACSNYVQETQIEQVLLTEEEEILNNNLLNPPPIVASEDADTLMVDTRGIKTASIQDKVVNLLHNDKDNNKEQEYSLGFVLTGECHFLNEEIKDILQQEQTKMSKISERFKRCFISSAIQPVYQKGNSIGSLISKTKI